MKGNFRYLIYLVTIAIFLVFIPVVYAATCDDFDSCIFPDVQSQEAQDDGDTQVSDGPSSEYCFRGSYDASTVLDSKILSNLAVCPPFEFYPGTEGKPFRERVKKEDCMRYFSGMKRQDDLGNGEDAPDTFKDAITPTTYDNNYIRDTEGDIDFLDTFDLAARNYNNLCYPGKEGQYYAWYQIDIDNFYITEDPKGGVCLLPIHVVDYDTLDGAFCYSDCVASSGTVEWAGGNNPACCGDDANETGPNDCAIQTLDGNFPKACIKQGTDWEWVTSGDSTRGQIKTMDEPCSGSVLITGDSDENNAFLVCNEDSDIADAFKYVKKGGVSHHYMCYDTQEANERAMAECHIETPQNSAPFSAEGSMGKGKALLLDENVYYCTLVSNIGKKNLGYTYWNPDLDELEFQDGSNCFDAKLLNGEEGKFTFTGTKCCGEPEDIDELGLKESYNDPEGYNLIMENLGSLPFQRKEGSCWDGTFVPQGTAPRNYIGGDIVSHHGTFQGCNLPNDHPALQKKDYHKELQSVPVEESVLINNREYCTVLQDATGRAGHLYCSFQGRWEETDDEQKNTLSKTKWLVGGSISQGCCNPTQCWNGTKCVANQLYDSTNRIYGGSYRCVDGAWSDQMLPKRTWDNSEAGFCSMNSQCLLNPSPYAPKNCIDDKEYEENMYCEDGIWTTRTKFLITSLLEYAGENYPSDYTLFCDDYQNIFNNYNYEIEGASLNTYLDENQCGGKDCVNQICVLKVPGGTIVGTSVNIPINSSNSFLGALGHDTSSCDNARISNEQFDRCTVSTLWYNEDMEIIVKLSDGMPSFGVTSWWESFVSFVSSPFKSIADIFSADEIEGQFFNQTTHFSKIYARVKGDKEVFAFLEEGKTIVLPDGSTRSNIDYFGLEYKNIGITPCSLIRNYDPSISCSDDQNIFSQSTLESDTNLVKAWPDLTSKLRIE